MASKGVGAVSNREIDVLVVSSQQEDTTSEPPRKRRRLSPDPSDHFDSQASEESVELPSGRNADYIEIDDDILQNHRSKYQPFMHEPAYVETQKDMFVTQVDQPWSSPTRIRGPRWRKKTPTPSPSPDEKAPTVYDRTTPVELMDEVLVADDFDDEDFEALMANQTIDSITKLSEQVTQATPNQVQRFPKNMRQTTLFGIQTTQQDTSSFRQSQRAHNWPLVERNEPPTHHKIDQKAMEKWIFPLNVGSIRDYQFNIVHKALFNNVLVALPTGLGKTFIAATVMMNWYNWTKDAQIVFMAPTKPLVAQQVEACFHIAGIPRSQTTLMTGGTPSHIRADEWQAKRVFFMTPQTLINDLKSGIADPKRLVLLVVDEAHKATGSYAYTEVVRFLRRFNNSVRILALTATPGASVEAVQKVIDALDIARVEIRTEDSLDIRSFVHQRNTELELFDYSDEINMCMDLFAKACQPVLDKLCSQNAFWGKDPTRITTFGLKKARDQWMASDASRNVNQGLKWMVMSCFSVLQSLAHNLDLLKFHGIGPFYRKMKGFQDEDTNSKFAKQIKESEHFTTLMTRIKGWIQNEEFIGHPKLEYLNSVVLNHFMDAGEGIGRASGRPPSDTRIMIFAHFRDSAEEICRVLNKHQPMIRAHVFVGQTSTKNSEGMDQKTQTEIIKKFKSGTYNTLVATSIGEEGLDIGEVDLIVCYDCSKSPIRMLQRMGRTGRKRAGNIVMLLMRDKEEKDYYAAKDNYQKIQEIIESGREFNFRDDRSTRIVPKGITPVVSKQHVEIPIENTQPGSVEPSRSKTKPKKKPAKKFHMPDGVETSFTFLGSKARNPAGEEGEKGSKKERFLDIIEASDPEDNVVFLSEEQDAELAQHYAWTPGDEPQIIEPMSLGNHPKKLRKEDKVHVIGHSKTTTRLIAAVKRAAKQGIYSSKPSRTFAYELRVSGGQRDSLMQNSLLTERPRDSPSRESQDDALPDLDNVFGRTSTIVEHENIPLRRQRKIICDDDDEG